MGSREVRVAPGGLFHTRKVEYSPETQRLLRDLINESTMTMMQRKQLKESVSKGEPLPLPPKRMPKVKPEVEDVHNIALTKRRTKDRIESSGAYERDDKGPTPSKADYEYEKRRLQDLMAYGKTVNRPTTRFPQRKSSPQLKKSETESKEEFYRQTMKEIEDRLKFLDELKTYGKSKEYEQIIHQEIAAKLRTVEEIDSDLKNAMREHYKDFQSRKAVTGPFGGYW